MILSSCSNYYPNVTLTLDVYSSVPINGIGMITITLKEPYEVTILVPSCTPSGTKAS